MKKIGWIGLGNMGMPMAKNLQKANFNLSVYNRSVDKTTEFIGTNAGVSNTIAELVKDSDIVFTMVSNDTAARSVYDEILAIETIDGKLFIDMSTISQQLSLTIADELKAKQAAFLDAPVAGSTVPAANATLVIMVGGAAEDLQTALPYLEKLGQQIKHLGPNGKGIAAKLSVNYFLSILFLGLSEAVLLGEKNGVNRADLLEIINHSAAGSGATKVKTPVLINEDFTPAFSLNLMLKDILLAKDNGADYALTDALTNAYLQAKEAGHGENDVISIINCLKD